jgi:hypothetical protein
MAKSKNPSESPLGEFIVLTYDKNNEIDAAACFKSGAGDAYLKGQGLASGVGSKKFQICSVKCEEGGSLQFAQVTKTGKK